MRTPVLLTAFLFLGSTAFADCPAGQSEVTVTISTDRYGDETTWSLTGPGGAPVYASGGPYALQGSAGSYPQTPVSVCIPDGSAVVFTIIDSYGDGICCSYGNGTYSVTMNGTTVVTYASFTASRQVLFQAGSPVPDDLAMYTINLAEMIGAGNTNITGTMRNFGTSAITSFVLGYAVDGGPAQTQTITANVAANAQYNFTHPTPWDATPGMHSVEVWVAQANSQPDGYPSNDALTVSVSVATQSTQRIALMEEFTSSSCGPCASLNASFDPMLANLNANVEGSHLAAVKYQMNWPSPGNDPSYNSDGNTRRGFYGVGGIPDPYLDGVSMNWPPSTAQFNAAFAKPSFASMDVSYTLVGNTVNVTANVTPHFNGTGYKTFIVVIEDYYHYPAAYTSQKDYHFAMRKMLPNGNGLTMPALVADQQQTFNQSYTLVEGSPAQGNYNLWGTVDGISVVAFLQKTSTKEIIQASFAASPTVGIQEQQANELLSIWPNPATDMLHLRYGNALSTPATVEVFNALGERVLHTTRNFSSASQVEEINLANLQQGMYLVRLVANGVTSTQRINLLR